jgi:hypothetical protein
MLSRVVRDGLRSAVLVGSTVALLAGTGMALAQPGSEFQTQGIRENNGQRATPSVWSRTAHGMRRYRAYGYAPGVIVHHHRFMRHHHY